MDPGEIWQTIVKADEALKYATADKADRRRQQAIERLQTALREAETIGNEALAQQARRRLDDLGEPEGEARPMANDADGQSGRTPGSGTEPHA
jgi:hypothetical protein